MYGVDAYKWAYGNMADFELRTDNPQTGPVVARASKSAFCLLDSDPIDPRGYAPHQFEAHCEDTIGRMGISAGYKDLYSRVYPAQWLDLDADPSAHVGRGTYYLVNVVDPTNTFLESNNSRADNSSYTRVTVNLPELELRRRADPVADPGRHPARTPRPIRPLHPARPPRLGRTPPPTRTPRPERTAPAPRARTTRRVQRIHNHLSIRGSP